MATDKKEQMNPDVRYEKSDSNIRLIFLTGVGLIVFIAVAYFVVTGLFRSFQNQKERENASLTERNRTERVILDKEPQLQASPADDQAEWVKVEQAKLTSYGWVDQSTGIVRIPIEKAMDEVLQKGMLPISPDAPSLAAQVQSPVEDKEGIQRQSGDSNGGLGLRLARAEEPEPHESHAGAEGKEAPAKVEGKTEPKPTAKEPEKQVKTQEPAKK